MFQEILCNQKIMKGDKRMIVQKATYSMEWWVKDVRSRIPMSSLSTSVRVKLLLMQYFTTMVKCFALCLEKEILNLNMLLGCLDL